MKNNLTKKESSKIGIWAIVLVFASILNMVACLAIIEGHEFGMVPIFYVVVALQFISLIEIYMIVFQKKNRGASKC